MSSSTHHARYQVYLDEQTMVEVNLDLTRPIYEIADELARQHSRGVPTDAFTFFVGADRRPLIHELSLARTPYSQGGELYLAPISAPWWISTTVAPRPSPLAGALQAPSTRGAALGGIAIVTLGALVWLLWPGQAQSTVTVPTLPPLPTVAQVALAPTATLLPAPTLPAPTLPPVPTADPATQASINYQGGLVAYEKQDWAEASAQLQQVFDYNPGYLNITEVLSASYYNWGIQLLDEPAPMDALDKFNTALSITPTHQPALDQQQRLGLYLNGVRLRDQGELREATIKLEELRAIQPDYLDSPALLYDLYIAYGGQLEEQRAEDDARRIYAKAIGLSVPDTSAATAGLGRLKPPPTATPRPAPTAQAAAKRLRFRVQNYNDDSRCISIGINGIAPAGWFFVVDGIGLQGRFDGGGNARVCGLAPGQEVTVSVLDGNGTHVIGGGSVPSKGSAIMVAEWR